MERPMEVTQELAKGIDLMQERIAKSGVSALSAPVSLTVGPEAMLREAAQLLAMSLKVQKNQTIASDKMEAYLRTLIEYRVLQINGRCPMASRDVIVPSFFYPVLSALGKYEDPMKALRISLTIDQDDTLNKDEMESMGFMLSVAGVKCSRGLPNVITVDNDAIFRVSSEDGELRVAGPDVGELTLLIRSVVRIEFSREVFGTARTRYVSVEDARAPWEAITAMAINA